MQASTRKAVKRMLLHVVRWHDITEEDCAALPASEVLVAGLYEGERSHIFVLSTYTEGALTLCVATDRGPWGRVPLSAAELRLLRSQLTLSQEGSEERKMPTYEYRCAGCGAEEEYLQRMGDRDMLICPKCRRPLLKKLMSAPNFSLSGDGWARDNYGIKPSIKKQET